MGHGAVDLEVEAEEVAHFISCNICDMKVVINIFIGNVLPGAFLIYDDRLSEYFYLDGSREVQFIQPPEAYRPYKFIFAFVHLIAFVNYKLVISCSYLCV